MKKRNRSNRKLKTKPITWNVKEKRVFIAIGFVFTLIVFVIFQQNIKKDLTKQNAYKAFLGKEVPDSMVCMVSGVVKHKAIHPIDVNGKIYWGCCDNCLNKLRINSANVLYEKDPITGKTISKSDAIIRLNPENQKSALFFESDYTYNQYLSTIEKE